MAGRLLLRAFLVVALSTASTTAPVAATVGSMAQPLELAVKATFLPKFMAYVAWPPAAMPPPAEAIQICVIGRDPFGARLDEAVAGQRIDQHPLAVRRLPTVEGASGCRLAFVGGSAGQSAESALKALQGSPILTVTDARLGPARGMVHFDLKGGRVGFHIDDAGAASSDLAISSRLLSLALSVKPREKQR
jgi:hypothetical protein